MNIASTSANDIVPELYIDISFGYFTYKIVYLSLTFSMYVV
jgi:hypothetical protein